MRLLSLAFLFAAVSTALGQTPPAEKKTEAKAEPTKLKIGDAAPKLKGAKFLQGTEFAAYEPNKVYIVEFWATWCGPCIQAMPHLSEINAEFREKGLNVVAVTTKDPNNDLKAVTEFVEKNGKKHGFAFAFCESEETYDAFMTASGQQGIPCSFVVDRSGKVAYIGHPMSLDDVIPKVVDGTWRGQADIDEIEKADKAFETIMIDSRKDPVNAIKQLDDYAKSYPIRAKQEQFQIQKLVLTLMAKKTDDAKAMSEAMLKSAVTRKKTNTVGTIAAIWAAPQLNPEKKNAELAIGAAEELLKLESGEVNAWIHAAEVYGTFDKKEKAIELAKKAIDLAKDNKQAKRYAEELVKKFEGGETKKP